MYSLYHRVPGLSSPFCVKIEGLALNLFHLPAIQLGLDQHVAQVAMGLLGGAGVGGAVDDVLHCGVLLAFDVLIIPCTRLVVKGLRDDLTHT